jgi:hypothetical protein
MNRTGQFIVGGVEERNPTKDPRISTQLFYDMVGWDSEGKPTRGKLYDLNLEWLPEAQ